MTKKELYTKYGITNLEEALDWLYEYRDYVADTHYQIHEYACEYAGNDRGVEQLLEVNDD